MRSDDDLGSHAVVCWVCVSYAAVGSKDTLPADVSSPAAHQRVKPATARTDWPVCVRCGQVYEVTYEGYEPIVLKKK